jgi:hypothetical protein
MSSIHDQRNYSLRIPVSLSSGLLGCKCERTIRERSSVPIEKLEVGAYRRLEVGAYKDIR